MSFLLPSSWRGRQGAESDDGLFDEEEGEGMLGFAVDDGRRTQLEREVAAGVSDETRLSRDLEEGFRDDSDEEQGLDRRRSSAGD